MTFLDAYARFGPDSIAISDALDIKEHEADTLINDHLNREYLRKEAEYIESVRKPQAAPAAQKRKLVPYAGYDSTAHVLGQSGGRRDEW
ncbi:hypothetical protein ACIQUG_08360 [Ensifer sp. NPDC090286]|uniref:hypothetical protein n=1 Tax=Ensifer sp. NPDC090286 TaxID=3363991 RepID=UPI00383B3911